MADLPAAAGPSAEPAKGRRRTSKAAQPTRRGTGSSQGDGEKSVTQLLRQGLKLR